VMGLREQRIRLEKDRSPTTFSGRERARTGGKNKREPHKSTSGSDLDR